MSLSRLIRDSYFPVGAILGHINAKLSLVKADQARLAELIGLSIEFIRDVEQGHTNLRLEKVLCLVESLGGVISVSNKPFDARTLSEYSSFSS